MVDSKDIKVSIVVPIYNVEKYLEKCLDTILAQTHKNLDIILVDDGAQDMSGNIADAYAQRDARIKVIHKKNEGVSTARNIGIDHAIGEYVCFADADDYLMPDYVEYLLNMAIRHDADIALTTDMYTTFQPRQTQCMEQTVCTPEEATIDILTYRMPIGVYCKIFRRAFLADKIRFIPEIFIGEGFNFNTAAFQRANKVVKGNKRVYFYRRDNPTSATTKFSLKKWENAIYAIHNIHRDMILHSDGLEKAWKYAKWHTHCDAYNFLVMSKEDKVYFEKYVEWRKVVRSESYNAFIVDIPFRERIRAIIMWVCPRIMPWLISKRNEHYL